TKLAPGKYVFDIKNTGKLAHDLAIKGGPKSKLIQPGKSGQLMVTLKSGKYHLYCSVPGHEQAGMKVDVTVSSLRCAVLRRGGRAVECGGLENRYPSLGGSRVQIPPPPLLPTRRTRRRRRSGSRGLPPGRCR